MNNRIHAWLMFVDMIYSMKPSLTRRGCTYTKTPSTPLVLYLRFQLSPYISSTLVAGKWLATNHSHLNLL